MSERTGKPGSRPREGIYLDSALTVIGEQVDERIDEISRRRRLRSRITIGALSVFAIASTSVAAVAITSASTQHDATGSAIAATVEHELHCIAGPSPHLAAYFTARYESTASVSVDPVAVCGAAHVAVTATDASFGDLTPSQLVILADGLLNQGSSTGAVESATGEIHVLEASFRALPGRHDPAPTVVCERDGVVTVVEDAGPTTPQDAAQCAGVIP